MALGRHIRRQVRRVERRGGASALVAVLSAALLAGCGGGGGNAGTTYPAHAARPARAPAPVSAPPDPIAASELSQDQCVAPRGGLDPFTARPYPDRFGTVSDEKNWVRAWIHETYLWFDEIPTSVRSANFATPQAFFDALRTPAVTASGKPKDRFHFSYDTAAWRALSQGGVEAGYGMEMAILQALPPRDARVAYTEPGSPATAAGIRRGWRLLEVNGVDVVNSPAVDALNAALYPSAAGQTHRFKLQAQDGSVRELEMVSAEVARNPVQNVRTLDTPTGKVGYLLFNDHLAKAEAPLVAAIARLKDEGVQDLVIDVRYNGGGLLAIASQLAYMVAGSAATAGATFERLQFNRKNPFGLSEEEAITPFYPVSLGFSEPRGRALPQLGLRRVTVLTGGGTCSASESIINGLRGVDVQVTVVGDTTCGKPYGYLPTDNCGTTYFAVQFSGVNHKGFGDYADGLAPTCQVPDDFSRELGDPAERRLAAALSHRETGFCPPAGAADLAKSSFSVGPGDPLLSGKALPRSVRVLGAGTLLRR